MISDFLFTNLFWTFLLIPGFSFTILVYAKSKTKIPDYFSIIPLSFVLGILLLLPFSIVAYALKLNIQYVLYYFIILQLISFFILIKNRIIIKEYVKGVKSFFSNTPQIIFLVVVFITFVLASKIGGYLYGDALVHVAKILKMSSGIVDVQDAFIKGGVESRYLFNIMYVVYSLGVKATGIAAYLFWQKSLGFLLITIILGFYHFIKTIINNEKYSLYTMSLATPLMINSFIFGNLPNTLIYIPICVVVASLYKLFGSDKHVYKIMFLSGSLIISFIHPTYSFILFLYLSLLYVLLAIGEGKIIIKNAKVIIFSMAILTIAPTIAYLYPNFMSENYINYGIDNYPLLHIKDKIVSGNILDDRVLPAIGFSVILLLYLLKMFNEKISGRKKILLVSLLVFPIITLYNPLFYYPASQILPHWLLKRLSVMNLFGYISLPLLLVLMTSQVNFSKRLKNILIISTLLLILPGLIYYQLPKLLEIKNGTSNYVKRGKKITSLLDDVPQGSVVGFERFQDNFTAPAFSNIFVVALQETNASPAVDMGKRLEIYSKLKGVCNNVIAAELLYSDVEYIVLQKKNECTIKNNQIVMIKEDNDSVLYKLKK